MSSLHLQRQEPATRLLDGETVPWLFPPGGRWPGPWSESYSHTKTNEQAEPMRPRRLHFATWGQLHNILWWSSLCFDGLWWFHFVHNNSFFLDNNNLKYFKQLFSLLSFLPKHLASQAVRTASLTSAAESVVAAMGWRRLVPPEPPPRHEHFKCHLGDLPIAMEFDLCDTESWLQFWFRLSDVNIFLFIHVSSILQWPRKWWIWAWFSRQGLATTWDVRLGFQAFRNSPGLELL